MNTSQTQAFNYVPNQPVRIRNISSAYTVTGIDAGVIINCTSGTFTIALTAAATLGNGFNCWIWNTGDGTITIDPNGSETIDGTETTYILRPRAGVQIICSGTTWITGEVKAYRLYQESNTNDANFTRPIASGFGSIAIGKSATATGQFSSSFGNTARATGEGSIAIGFSSASAADSIAIAGAQGLGQSIASASNALAIGINNTASSTNSTAIGRNSGSTGSQAVTGSGAMALGGSYASGTDSFAAAIANNTSTYGAKGANSVALGQQALASGDGSIAIGPTTTASGLYSVAIGNQCSATQQGGFALGRSKSEILSKYTYAGYNSLFSNFGDAQIGTLILRNSTTNGTATVLTSDGSAAGTTDQVILPNSSAYAFTGLVVARRQASGGTESAAWKVEGLIRREANAASTTLVASTVTAISNAPGWTLALSADTTNGGLKVEATGAASTNIRWVASIDTTEVTYA